MRVLLLETIENLGQAGDIVDVSEGYARNFLFPQGKAVLATQTAQQHVQRRQKQDRQKAEEQLQVLQQQAEALAGSELTMTARVKEGDEIYGSITTSHIAKQLSAQAAHPFKAKDIELLQPVKHLGSYNVTVRLSADVETSIKVTVIAATKERESQHDQHDEEA